MEHETRLSLERIKRASVALVEPLRAEGDAICRGLIRRIAAEPDIWWGFPGRAIDHAVAQDHHRANDRRIVKQCLAHGPPAFSPARAVIAAPACRLWLAAGPSVSNRQQFPIWSPLRASPAPRAADQARGVGKFVAFDEGADYRCYRGQLVGGEVNRRHGPDIKRPRFVQQGVGALLGRSESARVRLANFPCPFYNPCSSSRPLEACSPTSQRPPKALKLQRPLSDDVMR